MGKVDWKTDAEGRIHDEDESRSAYKSANADIIARAVDGAGTVSGVYRNRDGVRAVFNVSSSHLPAILDDRYQNCYAVTSRRVIGQRQSISQRRQAVDRVVAAAIPCEPKYTDLHYGAVELNGVGMRYYGDACIVLKRDELQHDTVVLFRNSYDLVRPPMLDSFLESNERAVELATSIMGTRADVTYMLACKMMHDPGIGERLLTIGRISQELIHDEDYFEVVRTRDFGHANIEEVRVSPGEVALELQIAEQIDSGPPPTLAELIWMYRREEARRAAARHGIPVRITISDGRTRT